jgi:hypothetical protein
MFKYQIENKAQQNAEIANALLNIYWSICNALEAKINKKNKKKC